jgi:hypothetical protein
MDGRSATFVDYFKTKTTGRTIPAAELDRSNVSRLHPPLNCIRAKDESPGGSDVVFGRPVAIVREDLDGGTPPAPGRRKLTDWRDPELGCLTLTYTVEDRRPDGTWWRTTEQKVVGLKLEEPDPQLFEDEPTYTEATPDELASRLLQERKKRGPLSRGGCLKTREIAVLRTNNQQLALCKNPKYLVLRQPPAQRERGEKGGEGCLFPGLAPWATFFRP